VIKSEILQIITEEINTVLIPEFADQSHRLTEAKLRKGDIIKMQDGEYGVVNKLKGKVAYIKLDSMPGSFHPIEADRTTYKGKHKGKDLYSEANRGKVFRAAKKGSYPVTLVAIDNGKVVHQELARTPEIVPAAFNVLQVIIKKKYPNAKIRVEDNTGKLLFVEGKLTEAFKKGDKVNI